MTERATIHMISALLIFVLCYLATVFHEGSHWVMARIWSDDLGVVPKFWIFPGAINIRSPYEIPPHGIRLAGMAPLLFCLPPFLILFFILDAHYLVRLLITFPLWAAALIISPPDLLAILYPRRFQKFAASADGGGMREGTKILIDEIRS